MTRFRQYRANIVYSTAPVYCASILAQYRAFCKFHLGKVNMILYPTTADVNAVSERVETMKFIDSLINSRIIDYTLEVMFYFVDAVISLVR